MNEQAVSFLARQYHCQKAHPRRQARMKDPREEEWTGQKSGRRLRGRKGYGGRNTGGKEVKEAGTWKITKEEGGGNTQEGGRG